MRSRKRNGYRIVSFFLCARRFRSVRYMRERKTTENMRVSSLGVMKGRFKFDSLSAAFTLLVGDSLAAEGTELVLHGVGDEDTE